MEKFEQKATIKVYEYDELSSEQKLLIEEAKEATKGSYSPYSNFKVGAAVRLDNGIVVHGANQENAAYPSGLCAERTTLFYTNANYPNNAVKALAIAVYADGDFTSEPTAPCGACRQVMIETEDRFKQPMQILLYSKDKTYVIDSAKELLPLCFVKENLLGN